VLPEVLHAQAIHVKKDGGVVEPDGNQKQIHCLGLQTYPSTTVPPGLSIPLASASSIIRRASQKRENDRPAFGQVPFVSKVQTATNVTYRSCPCSYRLDS
jgi:hypothetical protein